jgi:hypothetical protein
MDIPFIIQYNKTKKTFKDINKDVIIENVQFLKSWFNNDNKIETKTKESELSYNTQTFHNLLTNVSKAVSYIERRYIFTFFRRYNSIAQV